MIEWRRDKYYSSNLSELIMKILIMENIWLSSSNITGLNREFGELAVCHLVKYYITFDLMIPHKAWTQNQVFKYCKLCKMGNKTSHFAEPVKHNQISTHHNNSFHLVMVQTARPSVSVCKDLVSLFGSLVSTIWSDMFGIQTPTNEVNDPRHLNQPW